MLRRDAATRSRLIEKVITAANHLKIELPTSQTERYLNEYLGNVSVEDLKDHDPLSLAGTALSHLHFATTRQSQKAKYRVFRPHQEKDGWSSPRSILQLVNDDMPFIVDSISMILASYNIDVLLTIHPVLSVVRDGDEMTEVCASNREHVAESFVMMELEAIHDPKIIASIEEAIGKTMRDVRASTEDWGTMRQKAKDICNELETSRIPIDDTVLSESIALLRWMEDHNFTFLGYREYALERTEDKYALRSQAGTGLGIMRNQPESVSDVHDEVLTSAIRKQAQSRELLLITKANSRSTVHRPGYLDYIGVKFYDARGKVLGEHRFLGLFTSVAYSRSPRSIPLLRQKVSQVVDQSGLKELSHNAKALIHILENFPRDELFQASVDDLSRISLGILSLQERQRVKLFVRRDSFRRFYSCLVYVPRDKYHTAVRNRIENILRQSLYGLTVESNVQLSESSLARVHTIVHVNPQQSQRVLVRNIEAEIIESVRTWQDKLKDALHNRLEQGRADNLYGDYHETFSAAYHEDVSPVEATFDLERLEKLEQGAEVAMTLYRPIDAPKEHIRFKLCTLGKPMPLSEALPRLENLGFKVISEHPYLARLSDGRDAWIHDFEMEYHNQAIEQPQSINQRFEDAFVAVLKGRAENDSFNRLVISAQLTWRDVVLLRAICRYLVQTGLPFSQAYMEEVANRYPQIIHQLVQHFRVSFDPDVNRSTRVNRLRSIERSLTRQMNQVERADEDRILRGIRGISQATLRTNFFQVFESGEPKPYVSFKLNPAKIGELPKPRPAYEIFVYSPRVEGVHLRLGKIARGGLRWSDRREDFRTEVLGLMKAQQVKNTLIVPAGAKGGFVCKKLPDGDRDAIQAEVVTCYTTFVRGLLDVTDNIVENKIIPPSRVVRYDEDDPYLVVAADKGTATFSDIANNVAASYGFWLDDAFASGGSAGYDHKKMGITAKGAWEAVKRHFRELGLDTQREDFTVAGIGDMAGDVFGNGMLLSKHIRLQAAFNHLHIFLDPNPDCEVSFKERMRLFKQPRSSWEDYNREYISAGGGIFSRQTRTIDLSPEVMEMLDLEVNSIEPNELIRAILKMRVDLLWNGGIGTYVKAGFESQEDVGDRTNNALRVDGKDLRCKVIGEGGNLGLTQQARIEYAQHGGRTNTDFIDNSAGVDCSDHEVNIKILLNIARQEAGLDRADRDRLLADMSNEVEQLVLRDNYLQTQALSILESTASGRLREHAHFIRSLELAGELDRTIEFLPSREELEERASDKNGLTRPELAIVLSYSKISMFNEIMKADIVSDNDFINELTEYFPKPLQEKFPGLMSSHRLRKEIVATSLVNQVINRMGPTFAQRAQEENLASLSEVIRAFSIAKSTLNMEDLWQGIEKLDGKVNANAQYSMMGHSARVLRRATNWFLARQRETLAVKKTIGQYRPGVEEVSKQLNRLLVNSIATRYKESRTAYSDIGVPLPLARRMAGLRYLYSALDITSVANRLDHDVTHVANVYFRLGANLELDWVRDHAESLVAQGRWQAIARATLRDNLDDLQASITRSAMLEKTSDDANELVNDWLTKHAKQAHRLSETINEMRSLDKVDFPTLSVAIDEVRKLAK